MRAKSDTDENRTAPVADRIPWMVIEVRVIGDYQLWVRFADNTAGEVDLSRLVLSSTAGVFVALRDHAVFTRVRIDDGVVAWPGGLDLAPDAMYDQIKTQGRWIVD